MNAPAQFDWSPHNLTTLCDAYGDGSSFGTIACILGCSRGAVAGRLNRLNGEAERAGLTKANVAEMLAERLTLEDIARATNASLAAAETVFAEIRRDLGPQAR